MDDEDFVTGFLDLFGDGKVMTVGEIAGPFKPKPINFDDLGYYPMNVLQLSEDYNIWCISEDKQNVMPYLLEVGAVHRPTITEGPFGEKTFTAPANWFVIDQDGWLAIRMAIT